MTARNDFDRLLTDALAPFANEAPHPPGLLRVPRAWVHGRHVAPPMRLLAALTVIAAAAVVLSAGIAALRDGLSLTSIGGPSESVPLPSPTPVDIDRQAAIQRADGLISSRLTGWEWALVVNAHDEILENCMQDLGWDFESGIASQEDISYGGAQTRLEQWTFADVASAQADGYGVGSRLAEAAAILAPLGLDGPAAHAPDPAVMDPADAARFELEFFGREDERIEITEHDGSNSGRAGGGCLGQAARAVWGDIRQEMWLRDARDTIESEIWVSILGDPPGPAGNPAVSAALDAWRACVSADGLDFPDPRLAFDSARTAAIAGDAARERQIATTHAECTVESGLDGAVFTAFLAAANARLGSYEADLLALHELEAAAVVRAAEILGVGEVVD